jgi:D-xylose transport system substrate-binding protein
MDGISTRPVGRRRRALAGPLAAAAIAGLVLAACGSSGTSTTSSSSSGAAAASAGKIALLLPETKTTRYEAFDKPLFLAKLQALGYNTSNVIYSNANQDAAAQVSQADAAITNGAKVMVLDPVDSKAAAAIADKAKTNGIPVISYDRLILNSAGVNYYVEFDSVTVGKDQAQALMTALTNAGKTNPTIVMINGSPTDNNAKLFKQGAHSVFDPLVAAGKLKIAKEYDTPDWSPNQAQTEMQQALTALGNKVDGVYAANDGTGGGAFAAMQAAGLNPIPPLTGQDAELAAIQRIVAGQQYVTIYKPLKPLADAAATAAYALATGKTPDTSVFSTKVNNGAADIPTDQIAVVPVTKANIKDTVVKDGFYTVAQICTAAYASACTAAGLS